MSAPKSLSRSTSFQVSGQQMVLLVMLVAFVNEVTCAENLLVYPCVDFDAIRWVRDSAFCDQYYICHFGQPLAMPACPAGQVWSNAVLNCVPRDSVWDDCQDSPSSTQIPTSLATDDMTTTRQPPTADTRADIQPTDNNMVISIEQLTSRFRNNTLKEFNINVADTNTITHIARPEYNILPQTKESVGKTPGSWYDQSINTPTHNRDFLGSPATDPSSGEISLTRTPGYSSGGFLLDNIIFDEKTRLLKRRLHATYQLFKADPDHPCIHQPGALLPHPDNCHWYINCSLANLDDDLEATPGHASGYDAAAQGDQWSVNLQPFRVRHAGVFVWECRYPQLFDEMTGMCREFMNVDCKSRFQPVDQCEYSAKQCTGDRCVPCERRFGRCRGRENGVYPLHPTRWTPVFVTCYLERNIAQDECVPPTPIFSPDILDCVSLFDVPKQHGGFLPDCSTRPDGYYPDEQGRCAIFFRCALGHFRGYDECPPGSVFDPTIPACQPYVYASKPCGEGQAPLCGGKMDGLYADPHGRCTNYFQCLDGVFQQYFTCDLGIFDPLTQRCVVSAELTVRPCGLQANPCEDLPTGVYPDQATGCQNFIECHDGNMITNGTCQEGTIFSAITGRCDLPEHSPPPCGVSSVCRDKPDGRYPALARGCSFFYECAHGEFLSLRRCTEADGGIFFNPETGACDYPQNICPPCGYRWWGCPRTYPF